MKVQHLSYLLLTGALISIGVLPTLAYAQQPSGPAPGVHPTYVVHIPANAYKQGNLHYDPLKIAVPVGTTVQFANDDPNQVHTVTSGAPGNSSAVLFDSGVMNEGSAFLFTFDKAGDYSYYCKLHPWMTGSVSASGAFVQGHNIRMNMGTGAIYDFTKNNRTLLTFEPTSVKVNSDQFATYKITILKGDNNQKVFSDEFRALAGKLSLELVPSDTSTNVSGPDIEEPVTGAYHVQGNFLKDNAAYKIQAEITKIADGAPSSQTGDEFGVQIVPEFPIAIVSAISAIIIGMAAVIGRSRMFGRF